MLTYYKIISVLLSCIFSPLICLGQSNISFNSTLEKVVFEEVLLNRWEDTLAFMLSVDSTIDDARKADIQAQLGKFIAPFIKKHKSGKNQKLLLKKLNRQVGAGYLKKYQKFSNFRITISKGKYDCLSSTILYAYFFEMLALDYSIWETNYHIYLKVHLPKQDILIEPTDPNYGVICGEKNIQKKLEAYRKANEKKVNEFLMHYKIEREVNFKQLLALQYYNQAIYAFNQGEFNSAMNSIKKSILVYDCERNREFLRYSRSFTIEEPISSHSLEE